MIDMADENNLQFWTVNCRLRHLSEVLLIHTQIHVLYPASIRSLVLPSSFVLPRAHLASSIHHRLS
jgi:hypothetical protein